MKQLFITLFAVALIASCKSSTGPDGSFSPHQIGSFWVNNPTSADYTGIDQLYKAKHKTKSNSDTVFVTDNNNYSMTLTHDSDQLNGRFTLRFVDSTLTLIPDSIDNDHREIYGVLSSESYGGLGSGFGIGENYTQMLLTISYEDCGRQTSQNADVIFKMADSDSIRHIYKTWIIKTESIDSTVNEIACN